MNTDKSKKIIIIVIAIVAAISALCSIAAAVLVGIFVVGSVTTKPEVYTDITNYREYMSFDVTDADSQWNKWGIDESIWPQEITDNMTIADYKMVYYNPWDAQYLGYLVVDYSNEDYLKESERLKSYPSTDYIGYYSVEKETTYDLLAINADSYNGFVYALTDGKNRIIYAEQIFCNYFMDLDYDEYIPHEYLLDGFDASSDNPYALARRKEIDGDDQLAQKYKKTGVNNVKKAIIFDHDGTLQDSTECSVDIWNRVFDKHRAVLFYGVEETQQYCNYRQIGGARFVN